LQLLPHCKVSALPKQDNHCDCGLFVLAYLEYFVHANPPALSQEAVKNDKGAQMVTVAVTPADD
jgi:Ulp1 family protease